MYRSRATKASFTKTFRASLLTRTRQRRQHRQRRQRHRATLRMPACPTATRKRQARHCAAPTRQRMTRRRAARKAWFASRLAVTNCLRQPAQSTFASRGKTARQAVPVAGFPLLFCPFFFFSFSIFLFSFLLFSFSLFFSPNRVRLDPWVYLSSPSSSSLFLYLFPNRVRLDPWVYLSWNKFASPFFIAAWEGDTFNGCSEF